MAIAKNTAKAAAKPAVKAPATKPTAKPVAKAPTKAVKAPVAKAATPTKVAVAESTKVGRKELAQAICDGVKAAGKAVPLTIAELAVVAMEEGIAQALSQGKDVILPGFGKFVVTRKEAGVARNPMTGEQVKTAAKNVLKFKPSTTLKAAINE